MKTVSVSNFKKNYGDTEAVRGISFTIDKGQIFGLIGPNGSGKTTTLRVLATLLQKSAGDVSVMGFDVSSQAEDIRHIISYLPEDAGVYKNMTGRQYLDFIASFFSHKNKKEILNRGLEIANLGKRIEDRVQSYSKGMTRRLVIARALMTQPKLAILDEPTSGLDVLNAQQIRNIIQSTVKQGTTVLLSSHNMLEVEYLCDDIALVNKGLIVESGNPQALMQKYEAKNIEEVFTRVVNL